MNGYEYFNGLSDHMEHGGASRSLPPRLVKDFSIECFDGDKWNRVATETSNCQRLVRLSLNVRTSGLRVRVDGTWGADQTAIYSLHPY